jgi:hypothetical protein
VRRSRRAFRMGAVLLALLAVVMAGCTPKGPKFVDNGAAYSKKSVLMVLDSVDISALASKSSTDAPTLRHNALVALRSRNESAAAVADLLAKTFPATTRGVPVMVELASVDGKRAIIVVEAAGPRGGMLKTKRLWALDEKGDVIVVGTK